MSERQVTIEEQVHISHAWGWSLIKERVKGEKGLGEVHPNIHSMCAQHALMSCSTPPPYVKPLASFSSLRDALQFTIGYAHGYASQSITHEVRPGLEGMQTNLAPLVRLEELLLQVP